MDDIVEVAPGHEVVLTVTGVGKTYVIPVLSDVTLSLRAGEVLALTGENGAGKSTLSKIIGGLVDPTTGTMTLAGAPYAPASRGADGDAGAEPAAHVVGSREFVFEPLAADRRAGLDR
jgi:ribose transport system ATP-binding protein